MNFANEPIKLYEMARVGCFDDLEVIVWTDDPGKIPHFHIRDRSTRVKSFIAA